MLDDIHKDAFSRMGQAINHTQSELNKIRTGRANPEIFNGIVRLEILTIMFAFP